MKLSIQQWPLAGPAFNARGECLGMAFQSLSSGSESAENIGYVIPTVGTPYASEDFCTFHYSNLLRVPHGLFEAAPDVFRNTW